MHGLWLLPHQGAPSASPHQDFGCGTLGPAQSQCSWGWTHPTGAMIRGFPTAQSWGCRQGRLLSLGAAFGCGSRTWSLCEPQPRCIAALPGQEPCRARSTRRPTSQPGCGLPSCWGCPGCPHPALHPAGMGPGCAQEAQAATGPMTDQRPKPRCILQKVQRKLYYTEVPLGNQINCQSWRGQPKAACRLTGLALVALLRQWGVRASPLASWDIISKTLLNCPV